MSTLETLRPSRWWALRPTTMRLPQKGTKAVVVWGALLQLMLLVVAVFQLVVAARRDFSFTRTEVYRRQATSGATGGTVESGSMSISSSANGMFPNTHHEVLGWVVLACAVVWLIWQWSLVVGLPWGQVPVRPVWHIWGWLIPLVCWVLPVRNMARIAKVLGLRLTPLLVVWWCAWLGATCGGFYTKSGTTTDVSYPSPSEVLTTVTTTSFDATWAYLGIAAVAAFVLVGSLTVAYCDAVQRWAFIRSWTPSARAEEGTVTPSVERGE